MVLSLMFLCAALLTGIDQITKWLARTYLAGRQPFVLIDGVFELRYIENTGAAFGILSGYKILLIIITTIALIGLIIIFARGVLGKSKIVIVSCTLILAGGMGNLIDRVFRDGVIDFFYFKLIDFAIFNVADSFVVVGALLMLFYFLFNQKELNLHAKKQSEISSQVNGESDAVNGDKDTDPFAGNDGRKT